MRGFFEPASSKQLHAGGMTEVKSSKRLVSSQRGACLDYSRPRSGRKVCAKREDRRVEGVCNTKNTKVSFIVISRIKGTVKSAVFVS